ncbi:MAG: SIS domain-containing protein [Nocardioidaceae bacterium]
MFADDLLDDAESLAAADPLLRRLADAGSRVRRESGAAAEAIVALQDDLRPRAVIVAGADSRLLRAVLESWCPVPFVAWPGPGLPGWAGSLDMVVVLAQAAGDLAASSAISEAVRRGCTLVITASPHSVAADTAAGRYTTLLPTHTEDPLASAVVLLQALHRYGLGPDVDAEEVAQSLDDVAVACSPFQDLSNNPAKELAIALADVNPVLWGGSVLAARAARRVAEAIRRATGRSALAADAEHLLPVLSATRPRDLFADPFTGGDDKLGVALVVLDDGTQESPVRVERGRLVTQAESHGARVHYLRAERGSGVARYASLLAQGSYAAAYLGIGLGRAGDQGA